MALPHIFAPLPGPIPLAYLDDNFAFVLAQPSANGRIYYASSLGCITGGVVDNVALLQAAKATVPEGSTILLDGLFRIASTLVWDKRVSLICTGAENGLYVDVGSVFNGFELIGTSAGLLNGINGIRLDLNLYGPTACCQTAAVLQRLDRSDVKLNIHAGALAYALRVRGALINTWNIQSSSDYNPPIALPFDFQANHMAVENYGVPLVNKGVVSVSNASPAVVTLTAHGLAINNAIVFTTTPPSPLIKDKPYFIIAAGFGANSFELSDTAGGAAINTTAAGTPTMWTAAPVASNTNDFYVNLEGAAGGITQTPMPGEGSNTYHGEIEGLTGAPMFIDAALGCVISNLKMETNATQSTIKNNENLYIGPGVVNFGSGPAKIVLQGCQGYKVDGYYGAGYIDNTNKYGTTGLINSANVGDFLVEDKSCVQIGVASNSTFRDVAGNTGSAPTMESLFPNALLDIYGANDPTVGPPINCTTRGGAYVAGALVRETGTVYPGNEVGISVKGITKGTDILNGIQFTPDIQPWKDNDYVSIAVPVYCINNQARAEVYIYDGVSYHGLGQVSVLNQWVVVAGGCPLIAGNNWNVTVAFSNLAGTYPNGFQYYVGAIEVVKGPIPPRSFGISAKRLSSVIKSAVTPPAFAPAFIGQRYFCTATTKWYLANDTAAAANWDIIN